MKKTFSLIILLCLCMLVFGTTPPKSGQSLFQLSTSQRDPNTLTLHWKIESGYFLYRDRLLIANPDPSRFFLGTITLPQGLKKIASNKQSFDVYRNQLTLNLSVLGNQPGQARLNIHYQGCSDEGYCYPPIDNALQLEFNQQGELVSATTVNNNNSSPPIDNAYFKSTLFLTLVSFFGFGILLSFTPCILPMIPILSSLILGQGAHASTRHDLGISLTYVLSLAITYAFVGIILALVGQNLQSALQTPTMISLFAALSIVLALSMFGFFDLKLPLVFQQKLDQINRRQHAGTYVGAAVMGCLSTLILSPCVTPALVGALGYITNTGNVLTGGLALFFLGLGMGAPLIFIVIGTKQLLPKAGSWMMHVKTFFGILLLALAIVLLSRIFSAHIIMGLWGALFILSSVLMGLFRAGTGHPLTKALGKGLSLLTFIYGTILLIGSAGGNSDLLKPLDSFTLDTPSADHNNPLTDQSISTINELNEILATTHQPIILYFTADWCLGCQIMKFNVFPNPKLQTACSPLTWINVDLTDSSDEKQKLLKTYDVIAPPTFLFFNNAGKEIKDQRLIGEQNEKTLEKACMLISTQLT